MKPYIRLYDVCQPFRDALDEFERHMAEKDEDSAAMAWERVTRAAREFRAHVTPMRRE